MSEDEAQKKMEDVMIEGDADLIMAQTVDKVRRLMEARPVSKLIELMRGAKLIVSLVKGSDITSEFEALQLELEKIMKIIERNQGTYYNQQIAS